MKTSSSTRPTNRPSQRLARTPHGFDATWWGRAAAVDTAHASYWGLTRRPLPCLAFVLPILVAYEAGVQWLGGSSPEGLRTGADLWLRQALSHVGLTDRWLLPLALVAGLLAWQAIEPGRWRFGAGCLVGMGVESLVLAVALIGLSRLVDLGFAHLETSPLLAVAPEGAARGHALVPLVSYLGAGVYEEALFRLALVPLMYGVLRCLQAPQLLASIAAVTGSALLFSVAHHAGAPAEGFTWFAFIFRWLAGIYFAWVFVARGFGIAVGTHAAYDILVGWLGWHF